MSRRRGRFSVVTTDTLRPGTESDRAPAGLSGVLHTMQFVADDGGTRLVQEARVPEPTRLGRLLLPVPTPVLRRRLDEIARQLKAYVEAT